jgi:hypothetical protein
MHSTDAIKNHKQGIERRIKPPVVAAIRCAHFLSGNYAAIIWSNRRQCRTLQTARMRPISYRTNVRECRFASYFLSFCVLFLIVENVEKIPEPSILWALFTPDTSRPHASYFLSFCVLFLIVLRPISYI